MCGRNSGYFNNGGQRGILIKGVSLEIIILKQIGLLVRLRSGARSYCYYFKRVGGRRITFGTKYCRREGGFLSSGFIARCPPPLAVPTIKHQQKQTRFNWKTNKPRAANFSLPYSLSEEDLKYI